MQIDSYQNIGELLFALLLANFVFIPAVLILVLVMHFLMPRKVLDAYFRPPHFKDMEIEFFSGIPFAPIRTVMFIRLIARPKSGKVRRITDAHLLVPTWYRMASKVMLVAIYLMAVSMLVFLIGAGILYILEP